MKPPDHENQRRLEWYRRNPEKSAAIQRRANLARYGMTEEDFARQLDEQGHRCAICAAREPGGRFVNFSVDHDHQTGEIRGLLCNRCNRAMGMFDDDPNLLFSAASYLGWRPWKVAQSKRAQLRLVDEEAC